MGKVHAPVALSSSNKVDIMGRSFCLLSSLDMNPLSSCNTTKKKYLIQSYCWEQYKYKICDKYITAECNFPSTSRVVRYPDSFLTIGSRAHVLVWASQTRPRLNKRAFLLYFLCSMHTGHPINFLPMAVLKQ